MYTSLSIYVCIYIYIYTYVYIGPPRRLRAGRPPRRRCPYCILVLYIYNAEIVYSSIIVCDPPLGYIVSKCI